MGCDRGGPCGLPAVVGAHGSHRRHEVRQHHHYKQQWEGKPLPGESQYCSSPSSPSLPPPSAISRALGPLLLAP